MCFLLSVLHEVRNGNDASGKIP